MRAVPLLVIAAVAAACADAQTYGVKPFSLYASVGYGLSAGARYVGSSDTYENPVPGSRDPVESRDRYLNFGRGVKLEAGAMYTVMEHIDVLFGVGFSGGVPGTAVRTTRTVPDTEESWEVEYRYSLLSFKLMALPRFRVLELVDVYLGVGPGLAFAFSTYESSHQVVPATGPTVSEEERCKESNYPALLWTGVLGGEYPINNSVIITADISFELMSFTVKEARITDLNNNSSRTVEYRNNSVSLNPPTVTPASNVAVRVGARFPLF